MKTLVKTTTFFLLLTVLLGASAFGAATKAAPASPVSGELEGWMGTYYHGKKLGFSHVKLSFSPDSILVKSKVYIQLKAEGLDQTTSFLQETRLAKKDLRLQSFSLIQEIMGHRQKVDGHTDNGKLIFRVTSLGFDKEKTISFPPNVAPSSTFLLNLARDGFKVGQKGRIPIFVESFQVIVNLTYEILRKEKFEYEGKKLDTFVIRHRFSGVESTVWVTEDGTVMREVSPQGFESRKEPRHIATKLDKEMLTVSSLITLSLVKPEKEIIRPDRKRKIKLRLSQLGAPDLVPEDHRQKIVEVKKSADGSYSAELLIKSESNKVAQPKVVPISFASDPTLLGDSPEVQSNHPQIRALARELVPSGSDAWKAALNINHWVYKNLKKSLVDSVTALDALQERRGECQSHTYLFAAVARAAGIPTKIVNGLVYSPKYQGFLYHAWPEVYVGEWRALDPTFGQDHVDATHIKLTEGLQEGSFKLMEFVGKVQIKVVEN